MAEHNFIRMTVPSYMYHKEHLDYVVQALRELLKDRSLIPSFKRVAARGGLNDINGSYPLLEPVYPSK